MAPGLWKLTRPQKHLGTSSWDLSQQISSPGATPEPERWFPLSWSLSHPQEQKSQWLQDLGSARHHESPGSAFPSTRANPAFTSIAPCLVPQTGISSLGPQIFSLRSHPLSGASLSPHRAGVKQEDSPPLSYTHWESQFSSDTRSCPTLCDPIDCRMPGLPVHHQLPELSQILCSLSRSCHSTISSSVIPFSSCLQSFSAPGSFPVSQFFTSGDQNIGVSASTSVLPMNTQD